MDRKKDQMRKAFLAIRKNIPIRERTHASGAIVGSVLALTEWRNAGRVCVYESAGAEVDTSELFVRAKKENKIVTLPTLTSDADLFIIPGVVFDPLGWRLGRGRGFYDRLLAGVTAVKIGLAFDAQVVAEVPHFSYDVPMDMVVTEKNIYAKIS